MRLLLDTHTLIWHYEAQPKLSPIARDTINDEQNTLVISAAVVWEMIIKVNLGKLELGAPVDKIVAWYRAVGSEFLPMNAGFG